MKKMNHRLQLTIALCLILLSTYGQKNRADSKKWLPSYDFNANQFTNPSQSFGPLARWWWPGNDVNKDELRREINLFADHGFAGVEVQPMNLALPLTDPQVREKVNSWDTPLYYENLRAVMEEARRRNLIVDVTNGSGWPPAAPNLQPEDGFLSLEFSDTTVTGGNNRIFALPKLAANKNKTTVPARLQAVVVAKTLPNVAGVNTVRLDAATTKLATASVQNGILNYTFSEGTWKVIAFWAVPSGEQTNIAAAPKPLTVVDHLDSLKVLKLYNYLFGERTGLQPYFGNPMRSVFSDSYEFKANRHYSPDFLTYFKLKRGYDIGPYLPANMQRGYNFVAFMRPKTSPDFSFSDQDWRLRYDYDVTIGELFGEHFFKTSKAWAEKRGLLFRTQGYGLNMDMMALTGLASIPETESMLGSETNLKIMTSGALLYNRPIVTAESVVFNGRAYTTTPQKMKMAVDKLFAAGVNEVIYHGIPYRYTSEKLGTEGWFPFSSPFLGMVNFSSNLGEGNIFWNDQKEVNEYVNRTQYALRSGKPTADVLVYFPFLNVDGMPDNDEEILTKGYIKEVEGPLKTKEDIDPAKAAWAMKVYPLINQLEANGIAWAWVNDASVQEASLGKNGQLTIRGNQFQALVLANDSIIQLKTAQQIKMLAGKGMRLMAMGTLPKMQPSFLNWQENDQKTAESIAAALKSKNSQYLKDEVELNKWIKQLRLAVSFQQEYRFTRQTQREMNDGSRIQFICNKSDQWQTLSLVLDKKFRSSYWLNADKGTITRNEDSAITYQLPPYGSVVLYASVKNEEITNPSGVSSMFVDEQNQILSIPKWNIKVDQVEIKDTDLFDWKTNDQLKFSSAEGVYRSTFQWNPTDLTQHYFLDLGKVCFTAEVFLNGKLVGKRIYSPYLFDLMSFLKEGTNEIEVHVTPGQLNGFIGNAKNGDARYRQFKGKEDQLMSAGLIGPVVIRVAKGK